MDIFGGCCGGGSGGGRGRRLRGAVGTGVVRGWRWSWALTRRARGPVGGALPDITTTSTHPHTHFITLTNNHLQIQQYTSIYNISGPSIGTNKLSLTPLSAEWIYKQKTKRSSYAPQRCMSKASNDSGKTSAH